MSDEDELMAKEEARLKRLGEKGRGNIFGGGLAAAQGGRVRKPSGGATSAPSYGAPAPAPTHSAPTYKSSYSAPAPAVSSHSTPAYRPPAPSYHVEEVTLAPPSRGSGHGEVVSESIINPSKIVNSEEEAAKEEERMMKSIGRFARPETSLGGGGGGAISGNSKPAPVTTTSYQPPRGAPPSQQIRTTSAPVYRPPLESEDTVEEIPLPMPNRAPSHTTSYAPAHSAPSHSTSYAAPSHSTSYSAPKPANYVYPQYKVGSLQSVDNGTANVLPITDLACQISEVFLVLKNNGKALEFRRTVQQNGEARTEAQVFNLPYQVTGNTCTAKYHPNEANGTLKIRLGKIISGQVPSGEVHLTNFTVRGNPSAQSDRVEIAIDQQPDHYRFYVGKPSRFDTDFVVVLNGQALEFKSTYSVEEDEGVKTIQGTQKVQLPLLPTREQIDVGDASVTVWPTRTSGGPINVPEQDVRITHG